MSMQDHIILNERYNAGDDSCKKQGVDSHDTDMRIFSCTLCQNIAYLVINYVSQVLNGGHSQWIDNGYYKEDGEHLIRALKHIDGVWCRKVINLIHKANAQHDIDTHVEEHEWDSISEELDKLDTEFYDFEEEFLLEVETWVKKKITQKSSGPWYVKDYDDGIHGPFYSLEDAEDNAELVHGIVTS